MCPGKDGSNFVNLDQAGHSKNTQLQSFQKVKAAPDDQEGFGNSKPFA